MTVKTLARFAAGVIAAALLMTTPAGARTWDENYFPNYTVYDQDGNSYKFYDDLIRGKIVVANFVYTTCTDICGLATARMAQVVEGIGDRMGKEVFVYSISLTPEIDTPEMLKKYATAFGEVEGWKFLTGDPAELKDIRWKLGERSRFLGEHRSDMVMGNDTKGYWRRISLMGNLDNVTLEILKLVPRFAKNRGRRVARLGDQKRYNIGLRPGESLFQKGCSGCHKIGGGDRIGPDLYDVSAKRDRDWLRRVLLEPNKLRDEGDPLFTELDARYPNVLMPYLDLSEADARDVLQYIERRSADVRDKRAWNQVAVERAEARRAAEGHSHEAGAHSHGAEEHPDG
jgi:mono/diheme cytochrome c family protein